MPETDFLIDTNILIYHTAGDPQATAFINRLIMQHSFNVSILVKIEFLGWDKHTPEGFEKCKKLMDAATVYLVDEMVAMKAIEIRRTVKIKIADAVIAATALAHGLQLATKNVDDFRQINELRILNPLSISPSF